MTTRTRARTLSCRLCLKDSGAGWLHNSANETRTTASDNHPHRKKSTLQPSYVTTIMIRTIVVRMNVKILVDTMAMIWTHDRNDDDDVGARMSGWRPSSMSHHCKHPGPKIAKCRCDDECRWKADDYDEGGGAAVQPFRVEQS